MNDDPLGEDDRYRSFVSYIPSMGVSSDASLAGLLRTEDEIERVIFHDPNEFDEAAALLDFLRATDYERYGILFYLTSVPNSCYRLHLRGIDIEDDEVRAGFSERAHYESGRECADAVYEATACLRIPAENTTLPSNVSINNGRFSNEYRLTLEPIPESRVRDRREVLNESSQRGSVNESSAEIVPISALPPRVRAEVESALNDNNTYNTTNPPWLLAAGFHRYHIAVDERIYKPVVEDVGGATGVRIEPNEL